ncbi:anti-sigma-K factor RskA [Arthrobacter stackebrandtii]|uniref:Regulator of SigK n=1 Tax=Arthrobacter stackebrandtii TaxID=272161 RepID=A0ABS4YZL4_9MICC|nr:anti-sigma factor [Arthrobacter stackebrandtii]MBP2414234.1 anti-sigma-K factor RskA [Arthrobacter stackebrandtii]PYG98914.1 anti-sigma factor [Arthrobacter stackebrandtii]
MEQQLHLLTGAYALNAVTDAEQTAFERHALTDAQTLEEVRSLSETAALLAYGTPAEAPPPELKDSVMAAIRNTRQLSPSAVVRDLSTARASQQGTTARLRLPGAPRRRWVSALAAAAALLIFAGAGVGGWAVGHGAGQQGTEQRLAAEHAQQSAMLAIMGAPDAKISTAKVGAGTVVTVASSGQANQAAVLVKDMPPAPAGKAYELWFITAKGAVAAGLMKVSDSATSVQVLQGPLDGATHIGITVEPAGGSPQPTTTPILLQPI